MASFSPSVGPVDLLMSSSPSTFDPFSPSSDPFPLPSPSPPPPLLPPSTSAPLSSFDAPIDSPTSLSLFILRCREEIGHHARVLLATKLTNVGDEQIRQIFLDTGGLDILLSWLDPATNTAPVLSHTLDALSILPLTSSHLSSHPSLLSTLTILRTHPDESISQSADDLLATLERQRREGNDKEEKDIDLTDEGSKFRSIKIDKSTADAHTEPSAHKEEPLQQPKIVAFEEAVSPPQSPPRSPPQSPPSEDAGLKAGDAVKAQEGTGSGVGKKRKRKGLSVRWQEEERLEEVRLFFKEEPIVKREVKRQMTDDSRDSRPQAPFVATAPLTPTLDWYTPPRLVLSPLLQTQLQARGQQSTEKVTQKEREKGVLRSVWIPNQEAANPTESPESLTTSSVDDSQVAVIPFDVPKYAAPEAAGVGAESKPSGAEFQNRTVELLSRLSSLASLVAPPGGTSLASAAPHAQPYAPYASTASGAAAAPSLSSLLSSLSAISTATQQSSYPPPPSSYARPAQPQPLPPPSYSHPPPPPPSSSAPPASTSKLLSLLSNKSALSNLAAAFHAAPTAAAPTAAPPAPHPAPYSSYTAPLPTPPPPPPSSYASLPMPSPATSYAPPPPSYSSSPAPYYPVPPAPHSNGPYVPLPQPPYHPPPQHSAPSPSPYAPYSAPGYPPPPLTSYPPAPSSYPLPPRAYPPPPPPSSYPPAPYHHPSNSPPHSLYERDDGARGRIPKRRRMDDRGGMGGGMGGGGGGLLAAEELPMYKTKPCNYWVDTGRCKLGEKCSFYHEGVDPVRRPRPEGR